jgi:hypothetical protein
MLSAPKLVYESSLRGECRVCAMRGRPGIFVVRSSAGSATMSR